MVRTLAIALESAGISGIIGGIVIEVITHADFGYVIITGSAGVIALGGMIFAKIYKIPRGRGKNAE